MNREEAIKWLKAIEKKYIHGGDEEYDNLRKIALHMAIESLEQPEPCEDTISRQMAIDAVSRGCQELRGIFAECEKNLNELPSAQPEITVEDVTKYCQERGYAIVDRELYEDMITVWKDHCCADTERRTDG